MKWAQAKSRKPLILQGARQVGKTYFLDFLVGKTIKLDFIEDRSAISIFESENSDPTKIIDKIERHKNIKIDTSNDFIFFDEIQECPEALQSLKYFALKLPNLKIVCAGSFLGLMSKDKSFPIGYVDFLSMGPLSFFEFLLNFEPNLVEFYKNLNPFSTEIIDPFYHKKLLEIFRLYLAIGGMPEVVSVFLAAYKENFNTALANARKIQKIFCRDICRISQNTQGSSMQATSFMFLKLSQSN